VGSLSYAVGGALAGGGAGIAKVGEEITNKIMREGLIRLQMQYQEELQQKGFAQQRGLAKESEAAALHRQALGIKGGVAAQERTEQFEHGEHVGQQKTILERERIRQQGLLDRAQQTGAGKGGPKWTHVEAGTPFKDPDNPNLPAISVNRPLIMSPTGKMYVPSGPDLIPYDFNQNGPQQARSRLTPRPEETAALIKNPYAKMPSGMTAIQYYETRYGKIPSALQDVEPPSGAPGSSASMTSRSSNVSPTGYNPGSEPAPGGPGTGAEDAAREAEELAEQDREDAEEQFHSSGANNYSNVANADQ